MPAHRNPVLKLAVISTIISCGIKSFSILWLFLLYFHLSDLCWLSPSTLHCWHTDHNHHKPLCNSSFTVCVPHEYVHSTGAGTVSVIAIRLWMSACGRYKRAQCVLPISEMRTWGPENISSFPACLWVEPNTLQHVTCGKSCRNTHKGMRLKSCLAVEWSGQCFWASLWAIQTPSLFCVTDSLRVDYCIYLHYPSSATNLLQSEPLPSHSPGEGMWLEDR